LAAFINIAVIHTVIADDTYLASDREQLPELFEHHVSEILGEAGVNAVMPICRDIEARIQ
jgi:homoserine dehydrogenase